MISSVITKPKPLVNFGLGFPPREHLLSKRLVKQALESFSEERLEDGSKTEFETLLNYGFPEAGLPQTRAALAHWLNGQYSRSPHWDQSTMRVKSSELTLCSGVSQGAFVAFNTVVKPGVKDVILIENPSFYRLTVLATQNHARVCPVYTDLENGIDFERLEKLLHKRLGDGRTIGERVAAMYVIPSHQNPCGFHYSLAQRRRLIELAHRYSFNVVSDEVYSLLSFRDASRFPLLTGIEAQMFADGSLRRKGVGRVISICSLSKMIGGGFRLGWIHTCNRSLSNRMSFHGAFAAGCNSAHFVATLFRPLFKAKELTTANGSRLSEEFEAHCERVRHSLRSKAQWLTDAIEKYDVDKLCSFVQPTGGYFLLLRLPVTAAAVDHFVQSNGDRMPVKLKLVFATSFSPRFNPFCAKAQLLPFSEEREELEAKHALEHSIRICYATVASKKLMDLGVATIMAALYAVTNQTKQPLVSKL